MINFKQLLCHCKAATHCCSYEDLLTFWNPRLAIVFPIPSWLDLNKEEIESLVSAQD